MQSLTGTAQQLDRTIRATLRGVDIELLSRETRELVKQLKLACHEVKLDVRDYEYAQTRSEQAKWVKVAHHNLKMLNAIVLELDEIFGPADVAELSAQLHLLQSKID